MSLRARFATLACLVAVASLAGCSVDLHGETRGDLRRASFSYTSGCLFGCSLDGAMVPGTDETITLDRRDVGGLRAVSSDESIVSVTTESADACCSGANGGVSCGSMSGAACAGGSAVEHAYRFHVRAQRTGSARLLVVDGSGALFDLVALRVAEPATVELRAVAGAFLLPVGVKLALDADVHDGDGEPMQATTGVTYRIEDASIASLVTERMLTPDAASDVARSADWSTVSVVGRAPGTTTLHVQAGSVVRDYPVEVR